jgi:L-ascorbate metabolism protein UlaG (beta-lactamase superfamily)
MSKLKLVFRFSILILTTLLLSCNYYHGPSSDHFNGSRFFNKEPDNALFEHVKWLWEMKTVDWPDWINDPPQSPPPARVEKGILRVTYINQSTVLIQMDGINILTDPIWSDSPSPISWLGPKRVRAPGVKMEELPEIDIILISHDHRDHLDLPTLKKLLDKHYPVILVGLGVKQEMKSLEYENIIELDWWQEYTDSTGIKITFAPARHGSGRGLFDGNKTLWGGFVIESPAGRVLFMGDTAWGGFLQKIKEHFDHFSLAILPIGSYEKRWFMQNQHMNPDDAVAVHKILNVDQSMGIHFGTFKEHPEQTIDAHVKDLKTALEKYKIPEDKFWILKFGEGRDVAKLVSGK